MSEKYPNRREAMASEIEQGEKYQAMQALLELGICQKVNDLELYHGRVGNGGEWQVDPSYNNASNSTGNRNINKIPALNTGEYGVARDFSRARASRDGGIPEIHRIIASDQDAMVISSGLSGLNEEGRIRASKAISSLCPRIMEGAPIDFKHRNDLDKILPRDFRNRYGLMFEDDISDIESRTGLDRELITHVGSAMNTMKILESGFLYTIGEAFNDDKLNLYAKEKDGALNIVTNENLDHNHERGSKYHTIPINREYIANFFRDSHIVGLKLPVNSATLDKDIDNYIMFDLAKVNTPEFIGRTVRDRNRYFGEIATEIHKRSEGNPRTKGELLRTLESNLYIKPHEIINIAKRTPGFNDIFEADAGNWEGFKLGEHTETVLRLFDDNYADSIPASTLPIMRLALLVHDIGKPEAVRKGDKKSQKRYNVAYAEEFMRLNGIDNKTSNLVLSMIGDGLSLTSDLVVNRNNIVNKWSLFSFCEKIAKEYLDIEEVSRDTTIGFMNMLSILQTCDSAAYTTMAVTRASNGVRYRNHGSFNQSFEDFTGFTGRRAKLKNI